MRRALLLSAMLFAFSGCKEGKRPVIQAQFCLTPQHGANELIATFKAIAPEEGMDYFQRGGSPDDAGEVFHVIHNGKPLTLPRGFDFSVLSTDDLDGFSGGVSGPPSNQVMMGFTNGHDKRLSIAFARRVIRQLRQRWDVRLVSGDVGMFPLTNC